MSVHVLSWVLRKSEAQLGERLVLIVLADHARGEDGTGAWPSVKTMALETRLSERQVQRCLRGLEKAGAITRSGTTRQGVTVWKVEMPEGRQIVIPAMGADVADVIPPVTSMSPEPYLEPSSSTDPEGSVAAMSGVTPRELAAERLLADVYPRNAQGVVARVIDEFGTRGIPLAGRHRGILAQQADDLLKSSFDWEAVVLACVTALRRGEPQNAHFIAADLAIARSGQRITRREYERALQDEIELAGAGGRRGAA